MSCRPPPSCFSIFHLFFTFHLIVYSWWCRWQQALAGDGIFLLLFSVHLAELAQEICSSLRHPTLGNSMREPQLLHFGGAGCSVLSISSLKERSLLGWDSDHLSSLSLGSAPRRVLGYIHHLPVEIGLHSFTSLELALGCLVTVAKKKLEAAVPWTPPPRQDLSTSHKYLQSCSFPGTDT